MRLQNHPDERLRTQVDPRSNMKFMLQKKVCLNPKHPRRRTRKRYYLVADNQRGTQLQIRLSGAEFNQLWESSADLSQLWGYWSKYKEVFPYVYGKADD